MTPEYIRISAAAEWLGISRQTLHRWVAKGKIKKHKPEGVTLLKIDEIRRFIEGEG